MNPYMFMPAMLALLVASPVFGAGPGHRPLAQPAGRAVTTVVPSNSSTGARSIPIKNLSPITVTGHKIQALLMPTAAEARKRLSRVPGGTTLIVGKEYLNGAVRNLTDVLGFAPGVFVESRFGGDETRTSIRGSGVSQTYGVRGIRFLRDGLPLTPADGFTDPELIEPLTTRYAEVYRGANALQYGAATLGGAINLVSQTGYTAPSMRLRLGAGSHGYLRSEASFARVFGYGGWDIFGALSALNEEGFRPQARERRRQLFLDPGYRFDNDMQGRLYVTVEHSMLELPGPLTKAEIASDPSRVNPGYARVGAYRHLDLRRIAYRHGIRFGKGDRLAVGVFYQDTSLHHPLPFLTLNQYERDSGVSLRQTLAGSVGGYTNRIIVGGRVARSASEYKRYAPAPDDQHGALRRAGDQLALAGELFGEDQFHLTKAFTLVAGAQWAYDRRNSDVQFGDTPSTERDYIAFSPKIGATWQFAPDVQIYGNLSRSFEPPTFIQLRNPVTGSLDAQRATTLEIGTRGGHGDLTWDLSVYRSRVEDEILVTETPIGSGNFVTNNAGRTLHSGLELGVDDRVPLGWFGYDSLHLRLAYTLNRFRFDGDPAFGDNRIPGIPTQFGRVEILYERPDGFYIGPTLAAASSYYVDYANTLKADGYAVYGLRAGYDGDRFTVFVELRNLFDRHYASNTSLVADAHGEDEALFNPGAPRSIYAGAAVRW